VGLFEAGTTFFGAALGDGFGFLCFFGGGVS
jgi:hypothetical protein